MLCNDLGGEGDGGWGRREAQEAEDMGIVTADSLHCTAETNMIL